MRLPATEQLFWHCGAHTAEPEIDDMSSIPPIPYNQKLLFSVARGGCVRGGGGAACVRGGQQRHQRKEQRTPEVDGRQQRPFGTRPARAELPGAEGANDVAHADTGECERPHPRGLSDKTGRRSRFYITEVGAIATRTARLSFCFGPLNAI